jgi:hypothetical protein
LKGASPVLRGARRRKAPGLPDITGRVAAAQGPAVGFSFGVAAFDSSSEDLVAGAATKKNSLGRLSSTRSDHA